MLSTKAILRICRELGYPAAPKPKRAPRYHVVRERAAVKRIQDPAHPRGYRELCNDDEGRRRKAVKIEEQGGLCALCGEPLPADPREVELDHKRRRGNGGGWRDDHLDNLQATHGLCNSRKGSTAMESGTGYVHQATDPHDVRERRLVMALNELEARQCVVDEKPKRTGSSFCPDCTQSLPGQMQLDLYKSTGLGWVEAHINAKSWLVARSPQPPVPTEATA